MDSNENKEQIQELLKVAQMGVKDIYDNDKFREYLLQLADLHNYSYRNNILIMRQYPGATYVAGKSTWKNKFDRYVRRGENGIRIIGFGSEDVTKKTVKKDTIGKTMYGSDGKPITVDVICKVPYFIPVYVYDISQTIGTKMPKLVNELSGDVAEYNILIDALRGVSPYDVVFTDGRGEAKSYCDHNNRRVIIKGDMSKVQTIKTLINEIPNMKDIHALEAGIMKYGNDDRKTNEIEAKSKAFVICAHYGLGLSDYMFDDINSWSRQKGLKELTGTLERIQKHTSYLINHIENSYKTIKEHGISSRHNMSMGERVKEAKEKANAQNNTVNTKSKNEKSREV